MYDVAIVGGGPSGATCGALLKKYAPDLKVVILEREKFPRDHIGESLLPAVCQVLNEMGCWGKVEAAGFPIKIGATYRWGATTDLWDFNFLAGQRFQDSPRPASFDGQRIQTAFQVDRSTFDEILLDHAAALGCEVREETRVVEVATEGDRVNGLATDSGERIEARHYIDASGISGIIRRHFDVPVEYPTNLRNIAVWDYFQNTEWAVKIGVGGTRILIMSLGWGWMWFIPIGPTRTSIGLVMPLDFYQASGEKPEALLLKAIEEDPLIKSLTANATREHRLETTNDWSYIADRLSGENWWMVGDTCGFADPILSAGLTLAMSGARQVAYSVIAAERAEHDIQWLRQYYDEVQRKRIGQHVRFADFWYESNGIFTDLIDNTAKIAADSGLKMTPDEAFRWLGTGGFANDDPAAAIIGGYQIQALQSFSQRMSQRETAWRVSDNNEFRLNLEGAEESTMPIFFEGKIWPKTCYRRDGRILPKYGLFEIAIGLLQKEHRIVPAIEQLRGFFKRNRIYASPEIGIENVLCTMEAMIAEGWIEARFDRTQPRHPFKITAENAAIHKNLDISLRLDTW